MSYRSEGQTTLATIVVSVLFWAVQLALLVFWASGAALPWYVALAPILVLGSVYVAAVVVIVAAYCVARGMADARRD